MVVILTRADIILGDIWYGILKNQNSLEDDMILIARSFVTREKFHTREITFGLQFCQQSIILMI